MQDLNGNEVLQQIYLGCWYLNEKEQTKPHAGNNS